MDPIDRLNSGEFQPRHLGTTVIQEGNGACDGHEHDWSVVPIAVDDIDEVEQAKPGITFPMATFSDEFTCKRCKQIEVRNTRALL